MNSQKQQPNNMPANQKPLTRPEFEKLLSALTPADAVVNFQNLVNRAMTAGLFANTEDVLGYDKCIQVLKNLVESIKKDPSPIEKSNGLSVAENKTDAEPAAEANKPEGII